jgi:LmbE family N-acetylglucosaminyl deacetylase
MKFWDQKKKILVILAHPDDPEFFCGATIAEWTRQGHDVSYCLLTKGDKGVNDHFKNADDICELRMREESQAAAVLDVHDIIFMDNEDGYLTPSLELRKDVVRVIRQKKPQIIVTCDPTNYYMHNDYINHPDHRAAGQIAIDAVFPAAGNPLFFKELITEEGLYPHEVEEVWLSLPKEPNLTLDVTATWQQKINALLNHKSQIGIEEEFVAHMKSKYTDGSNAENPRYEEKFKRIIFKD